jgi:hypothetical protein
MNKRKAFSFTNDLIGIFDFVEVHITKNQEHFSVKIGVAIVSDNRPKNLSRLSKPLYS